MIIALVILLSLYLIYFKNKLIIRLLMFFVFSLGILLVISPELSSKAAAKLGIGRGVDLIFYISILLGALGFIVIYAKYRKMEVLLTDLIRQDSIKSATDLDDRNKKDNHVQ